MFERTLVAQLGSSFAPSATAAASIESDISCTFGCGNTFANPGALASHLIWHKNHSSFDASGQHVVDENSEELQAWLFATHKLTAMFANEDGTLKKDAKFYDFSEGGQDESLAEQIDGVVEFDCSANDEFQVVFD